MNNALRLPLGMGPGVTHHPKVSTTGRPVGQQSSSVLRKLRKWLSSDQGAKSLSTGEAIEVLGPRSDLKSSLLPFALLPPPLLSYHRVFLLLYTREVG